MQHDDPIDLTVDSRDLLPQAVKDELLPSEEESVLYLFHKFNHYPLHPSQYILLSNLQSALHQDDVQEFNHQSLLSIAPPCSAILKAYQDTIKKSPYSVHSIALKPYHGNSVRLPAWVLDHWTEIGRAVHFWNQWKTALAWV